MPSDFAGAFSELRRILKEHSVGMIAQADTPTDFTVVTQALGPNRKPMWFGAVQWRKSAVTYHLMPLYFNPRLNAKVAPELLARKQGKTCFNFQRPDPNLFAKLSELTRLAREQWESAGFLKSGPVAPEAFTAALRAGGEDPEAIAKLRKAKGKQAAAKRAETIEKQSTRKRTSRPS